MPAERPFTELMNSLAQGDAGAATLVWECFARRLAEEAP
jgi:hypothetical protein